MASPRSPARPLSRWQYACVVALALGVLAAAAWWRVRTLQTYALQHMSRALQAGTSVAETAVEAWLSERQRDALAVAMVAGGFERLVGASGAARDGAELARARNRLGGTLTALDRGHGFSGAWVMDASGAVVSRTMGSDSLLESIRLAATQAVRKDTLGIVGPVRGPDGRLALFFSAPIRSAHDSPRTREGKHLGTVVLRIDPATQLFPLVTDAPSAAQTARAMLVAREGDDLVVLTPMRIPPAGAMELRVPMARAPEAVHRALAGTEGWIRTRDFRGVPVIAATRRIDQTGWGVVRFIDEREALEFFLWPELRFEGLLALAVIGALALGMLMYERTLRMARLRTRLMEAELRGLKTQLQPHFLFNALNTLAELVHEDPHLADRMITRISDLLRVMVEEAGAQEVTLRQELEFLDAYLEIERLRFRDRLVVDMDVAPDTLDAVVPTLILQPIVENAIRHGTALLSSMGQITILARRRHGSLELAVRDNGRGLQRGGARERVGVGNTRARLRQLYGDAFRFELRNHEAGGVEATIVIPFRSGADGRMGGREAFGLQAVKGRPSRGA